LKGVLIGNRVYEAMKKRKGVIIIDPKQDAFLPQICKEFLESQGRPNDFQVVSFPNNFGYSGINEFDTYKEIANKFIIMLGLEPSDNPGVDYYRKNSRVALRKILKFFFDGSLGVRVKKDFTDILNHIRYLKEDLEKAELLQKELSKPKPNGNLIDKFSKRYYDTKKIDALYWETTDVATLDSLSKSLAEIAESGEIFSKYTLEGALYENKVLYVKVDMLDVASLALTKMLITDAIIQAKRKKTNTVIISDELSFYANSTISGALATVRSMGLKFILALQDLAQIEDGLREAILSNCNLKLFYKMSDKFTLEWIEKIGGKELISKFSKRDNETNITQDVEDNLNVTRLRAMPRAGTAIVIAEADNTPVIIDTNFIAVSQEFDWAKYDVKSDKRSLSSIDEEFKKDNYKVFVKEKKELLKDSDLFAFEFDSLAI
jgi:type IV secretion system protein VirD4